MVAITALLVTGTKKILNMKAYTLILSLAIFAAVTTRCDGSISLTSLLNLKEIWIKRPYEGPEFVIEVIGVDLNPRANRFLDKWTRPDTYVTVEHGEVERRRTQIEGNNYQPRFLWKTKMPHDKAMGLRFEVFDANVLNDDEAVGRAFLDAGAVKAMMKTGKSRVLSLGENIGVLKVVVTPLPKELTTERSYFSPSSGVTPLEVDVIDTEKRSVE